MAEIDFEFAIPMTRDDLLRKTGNNYVVNEKLSPRQIPGAVQEFKLSLRKGPFTVIDHFDSLFTILCLHKDVDQSLKVEAWHLLLRSTSLLAIELEDNMDLIENRMKHLNALKMTCYLLCQFMEMFEKEETGTQIATAQSRKKKKSAIGDFDIDQEKHEGVQMLLRLVKLNLNKLWDPPLAEEEFVSLITNCGYKLLENTSINRSKETRDAIFHLIGVMVKKYNHYLAASLKIIQLLQHFEHLASPLAQAVDMFVEEYGVKYVASEITREIGRMDSVDLERDASGCRSYATFLVELSERIPSVMLQNMSTLVGHLDGEAYSMRNAVLSMMGEIIVKVLSAEKLEENLKTTRDDFLDTLEDHIYDMHAFVRSKVLQIWTHIVNEKCLPLQRQESLVSAVIGRLQDVSSQVRRHAIQLITALLKSNPFAAKLPAEKLKETYEKETEKLKELMEKHEGLAEENTTQPKSVDAWTRIEKNVKFWLENRETDSPEDESSQTLEDEDNEQKALDTIYQCISEGKFENAHQLLKCAHEKWPEDTRFDFVNGGQDEKSDSEEDHSTDVNNSKLLLLFKNVFISCYEASALSETLTENPPQNEENSVVNDLTKQQVLVHYLKDCYTFANQIQTAVPVISQLLGSKVITDAQESIEFFVTGVNFGVSSAFIGVRKMMALMWSKESSIKDAVIDAYKKLYMNPQAGNQRAKSLQIVKNLSALTYGATLGELTSLEQLVAEFMKSGELDSNVIQMLWEIFTLKIPNTIPDESRAALILLSMAAGAEKSIIKSNIDVLIKEGLGSRAENDFLLAKLTCQALMKLGQRSKNKGELAAKPFRLPKDHELFSRLMELLQTGLKKDNGSWIPLADVAVNVIYRLAEHPDSICGILLRKIAQDILDTKTENSEGESTEENGTVPSYQLARFLSLAGDVAFRQLVHVDVHISGEMKRRRAVQEQSRPKKGNSNDTVNKSKNQTEGNDAIEDELGLGNAGAEDAEAEYIRAICEKEIVTGQTVLSAISPLLSHVCHNQAKFPDPQLQTAATLALSKFMMVSSEFCDSHLQLLFTILEKSKHSTIRANTIIALGDLTIRFPNMIEPWTPNLYARLRDESPTVRKNTLQVLTHLILNDRVKVKGQLSEMASCITDDDPRISGMAKLFFQELSHKGNAVYNIMPDIISRLSDPDIGVEDDHFQTIMEYLFSFIQKDKQCESLVEKLCLRYKATNSETQWRHLAFCMSMLSYSEKSIRKLQENFSCFADKLGDQEIYKCFCTILSSAKKFGKTGAKTTIDELEEKIEQCHSKGAEELEVAMKASHATKSKGKTPRKAKTPGRTPGKKKAKKAVSSSDSEGENPQPAEPRTSRTRKSVKKPELVFSSDEESDFELFDVDKSKKDKTQDDTADLLDSESDENYDPLSPENYKKSKTKNRTGKTPLRSRRILSSPNTN